MEWLYYLLEANLYLLLFYGFYRLLLQHETFYNSNRYYLMLSSVTAFILPVLQLGFLNPVPIVDNILFPPPILYTEEQLSKISVSTIQETIDYTSYLYPVYLFIALCFAAKLVFNISKIIRLWIKAKKQTNGKVTLIELTNEKSAFSFFNLLFIHPHLAEKQTVLKHEMVHIKQKHSLDILFFEILQIVCWFNPFIYFMKKDIKLLHEYIADELSTNADMQKHEYAMFLIENSFGVIPTPLTNQIFNQSILKRRINMLNKKRTAGWARLRLLLALPMVMGMLCVSTLAFTKDYGYIDLLPEKSKADNNLNQQVPKTQHPKKQDQVKFPPPIVKTEKYFTPNLIMDEIGSTTGSVKKIIKVTEKRYIVINGNPITDNSKFYGVTNIKDVKYLNPTTATKTYGNIAKYGAVLISGTNIKYNSSTDIIRFPPPVVKQDQIKFPPPIVRKDLATYKPKDQNRYDPYYRIDKNTGNPIKTDQRYVVINGVPAADQNKFYGAGNTESVTILNATEAKKKYGDQAVNGAVELTGTAIEYASEPVSPPPPTVEVVKFPPPIVKPDKKKLKTPPAVEPPPPGYKPKKKIKKDQVKFPPPIVKTDEKKSKTPPAVESPKANDKDKLALSNKVKGFLEEKLEETTNDETKMNIKKQLSLIQSEIAKKSKTN